MKNNRKNLIKFLKETGGLLPIKKRKFQLKFSGTALIELEESVIDTISKQYQQIFTHKKSVDEIIKVLGYNLIINNIYPSDIIKMKNNHITNIKILKEPNWKINTLEK